MGCSWRINGIDSLEMFQSSFEEMEVETPDADNVMVDVDLPVSELISSATNSYLNLHLINNQPESYINEESMTDSENNIQSLGSDTDDDIDAEELGQPYLQVRTENEIQRMTEADETAFLLTSQFVTINDRGVMSEFQYRGNVHTHLGYPFTIDRLYHDLDNLSLSESDMPALIPDIDENYGEMPALEMINSDDDDFSADNDDTSNEGSIN